MDYQDKQPSHTRQTARTFPFEGAEAVSRTTRNLAVVVILAASLPSVSSTVDHHIATIVIAGCSMLAGKRTGIWIGRSTDRAKSGKIRKSIQAVVVVIPRPTIAVVVGVCTVHKAIAVGVLASLGKRRSGLAILIVALA